MKHSMVGRLVARLALGAVVLAAVPSFAEPAVSGSARLSGAWDVRIDYDGLPACASAPAVFTADGSVIAAGCSNLESAGYGVWERISHHRFAVTFLGQNFGPAGEFAGTYKVRSEVRVGFAGETFSGPFVTEIFDPEGNLVFTVTGTVTASRIHPLPL